MTTSLLLGYDVEMLGYGVTHMFLVKALQQAIRGEYVRILHITPINGSLNTPSEFALFGPV